MPSPSKQQPERGDARSRLLGAAAANHWAETTSALFEEAAVFYTSVLPDSKIDTVFRPHPNGPALVVELAIAGVPYLTMNEHPDFQSNYASSVYVLTEDQAETDPLNEKRPRKRGPLFIWYRGLALYFSNVR